MLAIIRRSTDMLGCTIKPEHIVMKHPEAEAAGTWQIIGLAKTPKGNFARIQHLTSRAVDFVSTNRLERC